MLIPTLFCDINVSILQIIDEEETQFMTNCPPAVTESTPRRRTSIQVFWTAPPSGTGCVLLKYVYCVHELKMILSFTFQFIVAFDLVSVHEFHFERCKDLHYCLAVSFVLCKD